MKTFLRALSLSINEMIVKTDPEETFCVTVYPCDLNDGSAIVMFMEYTQYNSLHDAMHELHTRLSDKLGHPVAISHNHPTDECVLIHSEPCMAEIYYSSECCKMDDIRCCMDIIDNGSEGYRDEIRSLAVAAECLAEGLGISPQLVLERLDWDHDVQAQLIKQLVDFHK